MSTGITCDEGRQELWILLNFMGWQKHWKQVVYSMNCSSFFIILCEWIGSDFHSREKPKVSLSNNVACLSMVTHSQRRQTFLMVHHRDWTDVEACIVD